ncbi:MAG: metallophosphoesterase [Desulfurococcaceae archaeon]|jgi:putative phosphoesterase|nr:metallophosphoesterase [Desulfurococcaceae archaeon]MCC6058317.1 metallophosphoesterase [Desulfurococcaceae archaeon]
MIIGVMSDTHDNMVAIEKALKVFREKDLDVLIHLGDIVSPFALEKILEYPAKIIIITGNNDGDILRLKELAVKGGAILKQFMYTVTISRKKLYLTHGFGSKEQTRSYVEAIAMTGQYDIVLYGHTHETTAYLTGKTLVLNPGEVCGYLTGKQTVAVIDLETLKYEFIDL